MATIIDTIRKPDTSAFVGTITFRPLDTPTFNGAGEAVRGSDVLVATNADGEFSVALEPGQYDLIFGDRNARIRILVPNDLDNYSISDVATSPVVDVGVYVPSDAYIIAKDMRFSISTLQAGESLTIPARRQHISVGSFIVESGATLTVETGGELIVL